MSSENKETLREVGEGAVIIVPVLLFIVLMPAIILVVDKQTALYPGFFIAVGEGSVAALLIGTLGYFLFRGAAILERVVRSL